MYSYFPDGSGDQKYVPARSWFILQILLNNALKSYSEFLGAINLVLLEDPMSHVYRINRILEIPSGALTNAPHVGDGDSGSQLMVRQSVSRPSLAPFQIQMRCSNDFTVLNADLDTLYMNNGLKIIDIMFLMTDSQVAEEKFLVLINDMMSCGDISKLFADDEIDNIIQTIAPKVILYVKLDY